MYNLKKYVLFCNVLLAHFKQKIKKWIKKTSLKCHSYSVLWVCWTQWEAKAIKFLVSLGS